MDENDNNEDRISLTALARLASSGAPPPPPDWEEVAATPAAPSVAPASGARRMVMGIGLGSLVGAAVAAAVVVAVGSRGAPAESAATAQAPRAAVTETPAAVGMAAPSASASAFVERRAGTEPAIAPEDHAKPEESAAVAEPVERVARATRARVTEPGAIATPAPEAAEPAPAPAPVAAPPAAAAPTTERPSSLAGLMEQAAALPEPGAEQPAAAETEEPARLTPSRDEVTAAFEGLRGAIVQCAEGEHGVVELQITVGSSGRIRSALVSGHFSGSAKGSCMARVARTLSFPAFEQPTFSARYPFRI